MIELFNILNTKIINLMAVGGSNHGALTQFDVIAAIPRTQTGQLLTYIAQHHRSPRKLNNLITDNCLKHYNIVKNKRRWIRQCKQLDDLEVKRLAEVAINSICDFKHVTVRELAEKICEPRTTTQRNFEPVYHEMLSYLLSNLSADISKTLKTLK